MRILVTGAAGFVGYAVAALLVEQGHQVTGLTRCRASALPTGVQRLQGDLRTPETLSRAVAEVDAVCHLAGLTKLRQSRTAPLDYWRTNLGGTLTVLDRLASVRAGRSGPGIHLRGIPRAGRATAQRDSDCRAE